jgi:hypothetical protein
MLYHNMPYHTIYMYVHPYIHACIHTYLRTYIHTYISNMMYIDYICMLYRQTYITYLYFIHHVHYIRYLHYMTYCIIYPLHTLHALDTYINAPDLILMQLSFIIHYTPYMSYIHTLSLAHNIPEVPYTLHLCTLLYIHKIIIT